MINLNLDIHGCFHSSDDVDEYECEDCFLPK